jgi:hypothetical protein
MENIVNVRLVPVRSLGRFVLIAATVLLDLFHPPADLRHRAPTGLGRGGRPQRQWQTRLIVPNIAENTIIKRA